MSVWPRAATYVTVIELSTGPERVLAAALQPETWLTGWSHVEQLQRLADGDADGIGRRYRTRVRAVSRYSLAWEMEVVDLGPDTIAWVAAGDLEGAGRWVLRRRGPTTQVTSTWTARPTPWWIALLWPLARGLFVRNHDALMRRGAEVLAGHLGVDLVRCVRRSE